jgi:metal-responsive CopG/Arc/MetJ family transcriptional regulator
MSVVNFSIPNTLNKRVSQTIKERGFISKAEFFRFAAIYLMDVINKPTSNENEKFDYLTEKVSKQISNKFRDKKVPSLKKQLADL